ncbi:sensor histidine kinase [Butyrivibrio fibrisolvens]|uniref:sensor histidine kinase n=1 Tax=Butyrivibrio fibrisolvens TaxID=831 RepID=UPI0020C038B8|nr:sensor histidine kinase [Butyrivibrio fibrisolvens]
MSKELFSVFQDGYGYAMILVRGIFLGLMIKTFISDSVLDKKKNIILSAVVTVEGLVLFSLPISTRGIWTYISLITVLAVFFFYNRQYMPHIAFVLLLWTNVFYVWFLINIVTNDIFSDLLIETLNYSSENVMDEMYGRMAWLFVISILLLIVFSMISHCIIKMICKKKYDMSWTEALYLSVYSIISYFMVYMIAEVMIVPLENEVFILFDEKKDLEWMMPVLATLIFIGEMSAIATWQRYRRLKEEDLLLQEQVQEQGYIRKKIEYTEKYQEQIRTLRHDMAGKLMILKSFLDGGRYKDASKFLSEMDIELSSGAVKYSTGNAVTDVVINEAAAICEKKSCIFDCNFSFTEDKGITAIDMAIILNNLLDNAIEAITSIPADERYIRLSGASKANFYLIRIENSYDGEVIRNNDNGIISKKKNDPDLCPHGIGLKSVASIAEKYLGAVDIKTEDRTFEVKVMLQNAR